jgi:hypothetical protein
MRLPREVGETEHSFPSGLSAPSRRPWPGLQDARPRQVLHGMWLAFVPQ